MRTPSPTRGESATGTGWNGGTTRLGAALSTQTTDPTTASTPRPRSRWRRVLAWVALVLGCLGLLIGNLGVDARISVLDTDAFADVVPPEPPDEAVAAGVADTLADKIVTSTRVQDRIQELT